jgi:hypothetical protein
MLPALLPSRNISPNSREDRYISFYEVSCQRWQFAIVAKCPSIFDIYVFSLDKPGLTQTLMECG